jgi:hypothetical protein
MSAESFVEGQAGDRSRPIGAAASAAYAERMCHFITLVAPTDDAAAVSGVMERHGRAASPIDNPSVRAALNDRERQYLTTRGHCDCGTVLAPRHDTPDAFEEKLAKEVARMRRKGWSETKIARAIEDRRKADARPDGGGSDSIEMWNAVLHDLGKKLKLPYVGLLVRFYSGAIATEAFIATRRDAPTGLTWNEALASMQRDEVTIFRLS